MDINIHIPNIFAWSIPTWNIIAAVAAFLLAFFMSASRMFRGPEGLVALVMMVVSMIICAVCGVATAIVGPAASVPAVFFFVWPATMFLLDGKFR